MSPILFNFLQYQAIFSLDCHFILIFVDSILKDSFLCNVWLFYLTNHWGVYKITVCVFAIIIRFLLGISLSQRLFTYTSWICAGSFCVFVICAFLAVLCHSYLRRSRLNTKSHLVGILWTHNIHIQSYLPFIWYSLLTLASSVIIIHSSCCTSKYRISVSLRSSTLNSLAFTCSTNFPATHHLFHM